MSGSDPDAGGRSGDGPEEPTSDPGSEESPGFAGRLRQLRARDDAPVIGFAIALVFFPVVLVEGLGTLGEIIGYSIGGYTGLPSLILAYVVVVIGFNLLLGYTGLLSFGHAAFFGTAAYVAGFVSTVVELPLVMLLAGTIFAAAIAVPIGYVSIRRSGVYFAVLTLTFGQMLYFYALGPGAWLTGGDNGFRNITVSGLFGVIELTQPVDFFGTWMYVFVAIVTIAMVWFANRIVNSPYGLIFEALGENEQRVEFVGLNVFRYKLMAFVLSAVFAGVGGGLYTIHETYVHPGSVLYWVVSGDFVIMTVLGGTGGIVGPALGALVYQYIHFVISGISLPVIGSIGSLWRFILGAVFVTVVWVFPRGIWGALIDLGTMLRERQKGETVATDGGHETTDSNGGDDR